MVRHESCEHLLDAHGLKPQILHFVWSPVSQVFCDPALVLKFAGFSGGLIEGMKKLLPCRSTTALSDVGSDGHSRSPHL